MKMNSALFSFFLAGILAGCGGDSDSDTAAATAAGLKAKCITTISMNGMNLVACAEVNQVNADQLAAFETVVCKNDQLPGTYTADQLCATEAVVSTCDVTVAALAMDMKISYYADYTAQIAAADCEQRKQQASQQ
jgi:hypothetical protein